MAMDKKTSLLLIPLIIAIIAIIGLIAAIVVMDSDIEKMNEDMVKAKRELELEEDNRRRIDQQRQELAKFITGTADADPALLENQYLSRSRNQALDTYLGPESERREYDYLTELYNRIFNDRVQAIQKAIAAEREAEVAHEDLRKQVAANKAIKEEKEAEISRLMGSIRELETQKSNIEQQWKADQARDRALIQQERTEKQELEKKLNIEIAALRSEISEQGRRIQELIKKKPKTIMWVDPDGEVILSDNNNGYCWVNLGRRDGLRVGSVFEVFRYIKGGRRKAKGRIEIKKVEASLSQAAIIETLDPKDDPIVKGDHIISPFFDKAEVKEFVFAGELVNPIYSKREVVKMIEEMGATVARELSVSTDYLVAGKGAEETEEYQRAVNLGITILVEDELFKYLGK